MARPRNYLDTDVLTSSMLAFWQHGLAGTGIRDLEQATGMTASSIYNRFGSKENLFLAALDHYLEKVVTWRVQRYLRNDSLPPETGLKRFFETTCDYVSENRAAISCLLTRTALETGIEQQDITERLNRGFDVVIEGLEHCLSRLQQQNPAMQPAQIPLLARNLFLSLQGLLVATKTQTDRQQIAQWVDASLASIHPFLTAGSPEPVSNPLSDRRA